MSEEHHLWKSEEFDALVTEVSDRCRDIFHMQIDATVRELLEKFTAKDTEFTITQKVHMVKGDIRQIVGRMRRRDASKHKRRKQW